MLVLSRYPSESILIGDDVVVTVVEVQGRSKVRLGIAAPIEVAVDRSEIRAAVLDGSRPDLTLPGSRRFGRSVPPGPDLATSLLLDAVRKAFLMAGRGEDPRDTLNNAYRSIAGKNINE